MFQTFHEFPQPELFHHFSLAQAPPKYRLQEEVVVLAQIDEQGNIYSVSATSVHPLLLDAAAEAACGAKFTPTTLAGEPVKVGVQIHFNFVP